MKVAIIKYNAGNIQSVSYALERLGVEFIITNDATIIQSADHVIFPGVGEAKSTMEYLRHTQLDKVIKNLMQPVLGICLGMQLMCDYSEENETACLGIFPERVKRFEPTTEMKVPHIGWNKIIPSNSWLEVKEAAFYAYYVHSYYVPVNSYTVATTDYIVPFSAAMKKDNFYAVQFHPEKSADVGELILKKFLQEKLQ